MASQYALEVGSLPDITLERLGADLAYSSNRELLAVGFRVRFAWLSTHGAQASRPRSYVSRNQYVRVGKSPGERGFSVGLLVRRIEISGRGIPELAIV